MDQRDWNREEPATFNLECFLQAANELARLDEVERALHLLDNLPGYYRDNVPVAVSKLKNELVGKIATPSWYSQNDYETNLNDERIEGAALSLRAQIIVKEVQLFNSASLAPHIVDYGPGEFWLPALLKKRGLQFTYEPIVLHNAALESSRKFFADALVSPEPDQPRIYVACEIIEHLWQESELKTEMLRHCGLADLVHLSTPKYAFDVFKEDWRNDTQQLGHLRTYTPAEFLRVTLKMFSEYQHQFYDSKVMHLRLVKSDTKFKHLLDNLQRSIFEVGALA